MIQYGLISKLDAKNIEKTIDRIISYPNPEVVNVCEIGLYNCQTSVGIYDYLKYRHKKVNYTGIDNEKDKKIVAPDWMNIIIGNSNEVYNQIYEESQDLVFVDGLHTYSATISDFFCYKEKVKRGGYMIFHDTGRHIKKMKDYQCVGSDKDPDMYISVRKALCHIGLLTNKFQNWVLVTDEADENDEAGGVVVIKKLI